MFNNNLLNFSIKKFDFKNRIFNRKRIKLFIKFKLKII
jgi:hypothetical protein